MGIVGTGWAQHIGFANQNVQPPFSGYVTPGDFLAVNILTTTSTTGLNLAARILGPDGRVIPFSQSLDGVAINTFTSKILPLSEGWLISLVVSNLNSGLADNACFVQVGFQSDSKSGSAPHTVLVQGYVSNLFSLEWPPLGVRSVSAGMSQSFTPMSIQVPTPAAGAEWTYTVPALTTYTLKLLAYNFNTAAGGVSRICLVEITDGTHRLYVSDNSANPGPNAAFFMGGGSGLCNGQTTVQVSQPDFPVDPPLAAGWIIKSLTFNMLAGDQYLAISLGVLKWN